MRACTCWSGTGPVQNFLQFSRAAAASVTRPGACRTPLRVVKLAAWLWASITSWPASCGARGTRFAATIVGSQSAAVAVLQAGVVQRQNISFPS